MSVTGIVTRSSLLIRIAARPASRIGMAQGLHPMLTARGVLRHS
jgi:hypothetical protein